VDAPRRPPARAARRAARLAAVALAVLLGGAGPGAAQADPVVGELIDDLARRPPDRAVEALATLHAQELSGDEQELCLRALLDVLPAAVAPPTLEEEERLERLRRENPFATDLIVGRYTLVLATEAFAARAAQNELGAHLDLAYLLLRDLFDVDPVAERGHRIFVFPKAGSTPGYRTHSSAMHVRIGKGGRDDADAFEPLVHEVAHTFIARHPARHLFFGGVEEGWAEFAPAYVLSRLLPLGEPLSARYDPYVEGLLRAGEDEHVRTRQPIERIVPFAPAAGLLMELAATQPFRDGAIDGAPFARLLERGRSPSRLPSAWHPTQMALDVLDAFGVSRALPVLRRYHFPLDVATVDLVRAVLEGHEPPADAPGVADPDRWRTGGVVVPGAWQVLGPIPYPERTGLRFDPIDVENAVFASWLDAHGGDGDAVPRGLPGGRALVRDVSVNGRTFRWRTMPSARDGTLPLASLPEAGLPCLFYLATSWPEDAARPARLLVGSDDDVMIWLDGVLVHESPRARAVRPDDPDVVPLPKTGGPGRLVVKLINRGGRTGLHLRASTRDRWRERWTAELEALDAGRRAAAVAVIASRPVAGALKRDLLVRALDDEDRAVRLAAARGLGGVRDDPLVVDALLARWRRERDVEVTFALRGALAELTFEAFGTLAAAAAWWEGARADFAGWDFVECERAVDRGTRIGGYYEAVPGAYGGQALGAGWGADPGHLFEVVLEARRGGPRTLSLRTCGGRPDGGRPFVEMHAGLERLGGRWSFALPASAQDGEWRWIRIPLADVPPGRYRVTVRAAEGVGAPRWDVIGWR